MCMKFSKTYFNALYIYTQLGETHIDLWHSDRKRGFNAVHQWLQLIYTRQNDSVTEGIIK